MRILVIATVWRSSAGNPWLLDDLAAELARAGHFVDVIVADPRHGRPVGKLAGDSPGVTAWSVGPRRRRPGAWGAAAAHLVTAWRLRTLARRLLGDQRYDLGLYTSVGTFNWSLPAWVRRRSVVRRLVFILWDFFPVHQLEIGRLRSPLLARVFKVLERRSIAPADAVALMSDANIRFFRDYFSLPTPTGVVRPWASPQDAARPPRSGPLRVIFGGQFTAGRDTDTLLDAAAILDERGVAVTLILAGGGPALPGVRARAARIPGVEVHGLLPRADYRWLLAGCHAGIAITPATTSVPTFPSKIVEYCSAGVAVIVATEEASDAGQVIAAAGAGVTVPAGSAERLADALEDLARRRVDGDVARMGAAARRLFEAELSVARAAERLTTL
jgi:glycosyltransferase involved in cell wall biosynthesis